MYQPRCTPYCANVQRLRGQSLQEYLLGRLVADARQPVAGRAARSRRRARGRLDALRCLRLARFRADRDGRVIVVDASVLAPALGDDDTDGDVARARLRGEDLAAPEIIDLEVTSVWRRTLIGRTTERPLRLPISLIFRSDGCRISPCWLRCWELRHNLTPYDAAYVALAEALDVALLTADARLSRASGVRCAMELLA